MIPQSLFFGVIIMSKETDEIDSYITGTKEFNIKMTLSINDIDFIINSIEEYNMNRCNNKYHRRVASIIKKLRNATSKRSNDDTEIKKLYDSFVNRKEYSS